MREEKHILELDDWQYRFLMGCLMETKNSFADKNLETDDIRSMMEYIVSAPVKRRKKKVKCAER